MASSESRPLLLDVNALLALAWPNHQFHRTVLSRLEPARPRVVHLRPHPARFRAPLVESRRGGRAPDARAGARRTGQTGSRPQAPLRRTASTSGAGGQVLPTPTRAPAGDRCLPAGGGRNQQRRAPDARSAPDSTRRRPTARRSRHAMTDPANRSSRRRSDSRPDRTSKSPRHDRPREPPPVDAVRTADSPRRRGPEERRPTRVSRRHCATAPASSSNAGRTPPHPGLPSNATDVGLHDPSVRRHVAPPPP